MPARSRSVSTVRLTTWSVRSAAIVTPESRTSKRGANGGSVTASPPLDVLVAPRGGMTSERPGAEVERVDDPRWPSAISPPARGVAEVGAGEPAERVARR